MQDILVVDDQPYMQDLVYSELNDRHYTIITAEDIPKARVYLATFKLDLVILDLYVNGFQSWGLLEEIKQKFPGLPVLIVTAYDNFINDPRAKKADAYLIKDLQNIGQIGRKVNELLN